MKLCVRCQINFADIVKPLWCRSCKQKYDRDYWLKTREKRLFNKKSNSAQIRKRNRQYIWNYLINNSCIDCGETNPIVLQFDHIKNKKIEVSSMSTHSLKAIDQEIAKCQIRCANCHLIKTSKDFNWYKDIQRDIA